MSQSNEKSGKSIGAPIFAAARHPVVNFEADVALQPRTGDARCLNAPMTNAPGREGSDRFQSHAFDG
jgi:hypothetical protein